MADLTVTVGYHVQEDGMHWLASSLGTASHSDRYDHSCNNHLDLPSRTAEVVESLEQSVVELVHDTSPAEVDRYSAAAVEEDGIADA